MFEKNTFLSGLLVATVIPLAVFAVLYGLYELLEQLGWVSESGFRPMFRERTTAILAIGANAILLNNFQKKRLHNAVRGVVLATVVYVVIWVVLFGKYVL